tara:strand:- start:44389 stop:44619 length:231 start_codon:yes stop_codon:yes gene_type:complete
MSKNITEANAHDWDDFWLNSESEGKDVPQHLSEYVGLNPKPVYPPSSQSEAQRYADTITGKIAYPPQFKRESFLSE